MSELATGCGAPRSDLISHTPVMPAPAKKCFTQSMNKYFEWEGGVSYLSHPGHAKCFTRWINTLTPWLCSSVSLRWWIYTFNERGRGGYLFLHTLVMRASLKEVFHSTVSMNRYSCTLVMLKCYTQLMNKYFECENVLSFTPAKKCFKYKWHRKKTLWMRQQNCVSLSQVDE